MDRRQLFLLQLKKISRHLLSITATMLLLTGIAGGIFFGAVKLLCPEGKLPKAVIAVASSENTAMTQFALEYVESIPSFSAMFTIVQTEEAAGRQMLQERSAAALLVIPAGTIDNILNGSNTPVELIFADTPLSEASASAASSLSAALLSELAKAGVHILSCAQSGIYTTAVLAADSSIPMQQLFEDINYRNLQHALTRDAMFTPVPVSVTGTVSVGVYYAATAVLVFLFLFGIALHSLFQKGNAAYALILSQYGISPMTEVRNSFLCMLLLYCPLILTGTAVLSFPSVFRTTDFLHVFTALAVCVVTAASFILFCYELAHHIQSGILLLFLLSTGMLFLSGAFLPQAFFPQALRTVGALLPAAYMHKLLTQALSGRFALQPVLICLVWSAVFLLLSCLCSCRNRKRM